MSDETWKRDEVDSPCVKICVIHPESRLCTGCLRSMDEIAAWSGMSAQARREIIAALPARAPLQQKRRGGRSGRLQRREAEGQ
ncbi:DUF1289 domain-containing protein [Alkalilacustris brevis]|uniref:DUF1289 domain-containing protein n=1 Tax=Alkalilacustris brevis TaxID=2026338 RepID=UPI000E0D0599|nr:DUF1289 domain-containing protein [Alkalilacustris brevis]